MSSIKPLKMNDVNGNIANSNNKHEFSCTPSSSTFSKTQFIGNFTASGSPSDMKSTSINNCYNNSHNLPL